MDNIKKEKNIELFIITDVFPPDINATGQLLDELATFLSKYFNIEVLTNKTKSDFVEFDNSKEYSIKRFLKPQKNKKNKILRLFNGLKFSFYTFFYLLFKKKEAILFFVSNPPFLALVGFFLNLIRGQRYIYLIYDIYPDIAINFSYLRENSIIANIWRFFNNKIFKMAKYNIMLGDMSANYLSKNYKTLKLNNNLKIIPNWGQKERLFPLPNKNSLKEKYNLKDKFVILYSGNFGITSILDMVLDIPFLLKKEKDIVFLFVGDGQKKEKLKKIKEENELSNVIFIDFVEKKRLNELLNIGDVSLITLDKRGSNLSIPSKFYNIIAVGSPVIAIMEKETDIGKIIENENNNGRSIGYIFEEEQIKEIAEQILYLFSNSQIVEEIGKNSRDLFLKKYSSDTIFPIYKKLIIESGEYMVDFHTHTTCSDGVLKPDELIKKAKLEGLKAIAITDHDNIRGIELAKECAITENIGLIPGIEISCKFNNSEIHIIGLFIDIYNEDFLNFTKKLSGYRLDRNVEMIKKYEEHFSKKINIDELVGEKRLENLGKLDFVRYMIKSGDIKNENAAFKFYFPKGCPLFVERKYTTIEEAIEKIHLAKGIAILAHPKQIEVKEKNEFIEIMKMLKSNGLDGIEVYYTNHKKKDVKYYKKIAKEFGLFISGGSDFHYESYRGNTKLGHYGKKKKIPYIEKWK